MTDAAEIERWLERLAELRRSRLLRVAEGASPYRGLAGFEERHADWFLGRERLRAVVDRILSEGADVPQLLVGASGSGKSSLLQAGVLPVLRGEHGFLPLQLTPGRNPMGALKRPPCPHSGTPCTGRSGGRCRRTRRTHRSVGPTGERTRRRGGRSAGGGVHPHAPTPLKVSRPSRCPGWWRRAPNGCGAATLPSPRNSVWWRTVRLPRQRPGRR